ncbi:MAG: hypothetical protein AAF721_29755 [Myxococcota bacterium]
MKRPRARGLGIAAVPLLIVVGSVACKTDKPSTSPAAADTARAGGGDGGITEAGRVEQVELLRPGAGHSANIDLVAADRKGSSAVTRDQIGGVRLWPTLDGSREPVIIPERGALSLSVERRGKSHTVALVDAAGGGKIFSVSKDGEAELTGEMPPFEPLFELHVLPGGKHVLALRKDHSMHVHDIRGKLVASFTERRFRPQSLQVAADGKAFAAVIKEKAALKAEVQRLRIERKGEGFSIARLGSPTLVESAAQLSPATLSISADLSRVAWVDRSVGNGWELKLARLTDDAQSTSFTVVAPSHVTPAIGFADATRLLISANDGGLSWLRDTKANSTHARTAAPQDFVNQGKAQAVRGGVQIAAMGTWLFVHDVKARSHRYLGYQATQTQAVALSPSGEHVAWSYSSGAVFVETLGDEAAGAVKLQLDRSAPAFKLIFVDPDHLVIATAAGALRLVSWRDGRTVAEGGVSGTIRNVQFDAKRRLLLVERHNNDATVFEMTADGFGDGYLVADQAFRSGLLTEGIDGVQDAVMWSLDSSNHIRLYTLKDLRADLSNEDITMMGKPLPSGTAAPLAIDRSGRRYGVRWSGSRMELFVDDGVRITAEVAPAGDVNQIVVSPDDKLFLAIHQRGNSASISAHDSESLRQLWAFNAGVFTNQVVWSRDGRFVGLAASTGAAVLDARTGEAVQRRCGLEFAATRSAPPSAFGGQQLPSLCEG